MPRSDPLLDRADTARWRDNNRDRYNAYQRDRRHKPLPDDLDAAKAANPQDPRLPTPHGTVARYQRHGCRCAPCKQAKSDATALNKARKKAKDTGQLLDEQAWWGERMARQT